MIYSGSLGEISNKANWISRVFTITQESNGSDVDLSDPLFGTEIEIVVRKQGSKANELAGTLADGTVALSEGGFYWHFLPEDVSVLCPGTYDVGVAVTISGIKYDIILATVAVLEGV